MIRIQNTDPHLQSIKQVINVITRRAIMAPQRLLLLTRMLLMMIVMVNLAHGRNAQKNKKKLDGHVCPSQLGIQEDATFPETVKVHIRIAHAEPASRMLHDVKNRSISPWDYRINEDPNRFPHIISEASCRYFACLDSTGHKLHYNMHSVPIQQEILVLKRKQVGCQQTYWLEKQVVTVGCTCALAETNLY